MRLSLASRSSRTLVPAPPLSSPTACDRPFSLFASKFSRSHTPKNSQQPGPLNLFEQLYHAPRLRFRAESIVNASSSRELKTNTLQTLCVLRITQTQWERSDGCMRSARGLVSAPLPSLPPFPFLPSPSILFRVLTPCFRLLSLGRPLLLLLRLLERSFANGFMHVSHLSLQHASGE